MLAKADYDIDREEAIGLRQIWRQRLAIATKFSGIVVSGRRPSCQVRRCLRSAIWPLAKVFCLVSFPQPQTLVAGVTRISRRRPSCQVRRCLRSAIWPSAKVLSQNPSSGGNPHLWEKAKLSSMTVSEITELAFGQSFVFNQPPPNPKTLVAAVTLSSGRRPSCWFAL